MDPPEVRAVDAPDSRRDLPRDIWGLVCIPTAWRLYRPVPQLQNRSKVLFRHNRHPMTLDQAKSCYLAAAGDANRWEDYSPREQADIHQEMDRIVAVKTDRAAAKVIHWWGCWDSRYTATAFARRVRNAYAELKAQETQ